jgi:rubrerythrin
VTLAPLHRTLEQELFALLRGASLECPVCGEFVLHEGPVVRCPECGLKAHGRFHSVSEQRAQTSIAFESQAG